MERNLSLLVDLYELTMGQCYLDYRQDTQATFDLFIRQLPQHRMYLIACGLESALDYIRNLRFSRADIKYLKKQKIFSPRFLRYLTNFRFKGDIWAMPEGQIFFPNEPVLRVTASIIEAQMIESFLLNTVNLQTMIASKAARVVLAAGNRGVYDFALRRTHGWDAGIKVGRASYIAGFRGTSNVLSGKLYKIPVVGTMAHSFVMSFKEEIDSFLAYSEVFPENSILLVDTYNIKKGIENAIKIGLYLKAKNYKLRGIRLDSGNLVTLSKLARRLLNQAGLVYVKIFASGNLDEFKIKDMLARGACIDSFGVGTNMGTSIDAPALDVIYKVSEVTDEEGRFLPTMKLSQAKVTYPGRKQVFRIQDKSGRFIKDILGLEKERINPVRNTNFGCESKISNGVKGKPLLIKVVNQGRIVYKSPPLEKIRRFTQNNLSRLPERLKRVYSRDKYPVVISPQLRKLREGLSAQLKRRQ